jgi:hypothetical protein
VLAALLRAYAAALSGPLPLFPSASRRYAELLASGKPRELALAQARKAFTSAGPLAFNADDRDAYVQQLFADFDTALEQQPGEFEAAAESVYLPLFEHRRTP